MRPRLQSLVHVGHRHLRHVLRRQGQLRAARHMQPLHQLRPLVHHLPRLLADRPAAEDAVVVESGLAEVLELGVVSQADVDELEEGGVVGRALVDVEAEALRQVVLDGVQGLGGVATLEDAVELLAA